MNPGPLKRVDMLNSQTMAQDVKDYLEIVTALGVVVACGYLRQIAKLLERLQEEFTPRTDGARGLRSLLVEIACEVKNRA